MTYENELAKEFLRDAFMTGALDLGSDRKFLEGFLRIFAGEMEALIAINQARYLGREGQLELLPLAEPSAEAFSHYKTWAARIK